jgi:hypothetical protein
MEFGPSYTLQLWGPAVQCHDSNFTNVASLENMHIDYLDSEGNIAYFENNTRNFDLSSNIWSSENSTDGSYLVWKQRLEQDFYYSPCLPEDFDWSMRLNKPEVRPVRISLFQPLQKTECFRAAAKYDVHVNVVDGVQRFSYSATDVKPFPHAIQSSNSSGLGPLRSWEEYFNMNTLLDSLGVNLEYQGDQVSHFAFPNKRSPNSQRLLRIPIPVLNPRASKSAVSMAFPGSSI